ncbi:MAG TPA: hypothetical protein DCL54_15815, partial [Alphaproteobacteria bacterium]|nr:hypothetical protein [Alphaproteobacteria bacterium]
GPGCAAQGTPSRAASRPVRAQGSGPSPSQGPSASPAVSSPFIPEFQDENGYRAKTGEIIALFPTEQSNRVFQEQGFEVLRRLTFPALAIEATILKVPAKLNTRNAVKLLREKDPQTRYDYNHLYDFRPSRDVGIPYRPGMDIFERKTLSTRTDVAVGIIDTGVNVTHPDLSAARVEQKRFEKLADGVSLSHGTGVASILADQRDGLVPNAQLYAASVFGPAKAGDPVGAVVEISQAIDWMVGKSVAVLNMSLAGPPNALLELAVTKATAKGHAIVAAVGNMGPAAKPLYPASYPGVVGVTAVDKTDKIYRRAAQGAQVDFSGPGVSIKSASGTGSGETVHTGTSFAVPFVAAVIALEVTRPNPSTLKTAISKSEKSAQDLGTPGRDDVFGHGRVKLAP